jgi:hypothetical protein
MKTDEVRELLELLMAQHGLTAAGWTLGSVLRSGDPENFCGGTRHAEKDIWIFSSSIDLLSQARITDLILHEIAHALVGPSHGHDVTWKAKALEIGVSAEFMELHAQGLECQETTNGKVPPETP